MTVPGVGSDMFKNTPLWYKITFFANKFFLNQNGKKESKEKDYTPPSSDEEEFFRLVSLGTYSGSRPGEK